LKQQSENLSDLERTKAGRKGKTKNIK